MYVDNFDDLFGVLIDFLITVTVVLVTLFLLDLLLSGLFASIVLVFTNHKLEVLVASHLSLLASRSD